MPSFSDEFVAELRRKFLLEKIKKEDFQKWDKWQKETHLRLTEEALQQQELLLEKQIEEIAFTKKTITNLKKRIKNVSETDIYNRNIIHYLVIYSSNLTFSNLLKELGPVGESAFMKYRLEIEIKYFLEMVKIKNYKYNDEGYSKSLINTLSNNYSLMNNIYNETYLTNSLNLKYKQVF